MKQHLPQYRSKPCRGVKTMLDVALIGRTGDSDEIVPS